MTANNAAPAKRNINLAAGRTGGEEFGGKRVKAEERADEDGKCDSVSRAAMLWLSAMRRSQLQRAQASDEGEHPIVADEVPGDVGSNHTRIIAETRRARQNGFLAQTR